MEMPLIGPTGLVLAQILHLDARQVERGIYRFSDTYPKQVRGDLQIPAFDLGHLRAQKVSTPPIRAPSSQILPEHSNPPLIRTLPPISAPYPTSASPSATFSLAPRQSKSPFIRAPGSLIVPEDVKLSLRRTLPPITAHSANSASPSFTSSFAPVQSKSPLICAPCSLIVPEDSNPSIRKTLPPISAPSASSAFSSSTTSFAPRQSKSPLTCAPPSRTSPENRLPRRKIGPCASIPSASTAPSTEQSQR